MKSKHFYVLVLTVFFAFFSRAQNIQILKENFESGGFTFFLNGAGVGTSSGNNKWIINNNYTGGVGYPSTISQDSTFGGTISYAPYGKYLHIYDSGSPYSNCNYNPVNPSDQFAFMTSGLCTMGIYKVSLNLFYMGQGSANAYGQIYYSVNFGSWTQVGNPQYSGKYKWQYATVSNPAFDNVANLRFGFRWQNNAGTGTDTSSWAIDDINIVGQYDSILHPVDINMSTPATVCQGQLLFANFKMSDTLCDGTYTLQLSDANGKFTPPLLTWVDYIYFPQDSGVIPVVIPTSGVPVGNCYKVRLIRNSPAPAVTGIASACFSIIKCPNIITTLKPIIVSDSNAVCAGSVIDVPFSSTGTFNNNNIYTAQLSDSSGSFATFSSLGTFPSNATYDPAIGTPPGSVSGLIPKNIPAGCKYYIRVISSSPATTGAIWGPFCIQHCDLETNKQQNISACLTHCFKNSATQTVVINYDINYYNSLTKYGAGNKFEVQLLSSKTFGLVNTGGLATKIDTVSGTMSIQLPCAETLNSLYGITSGLYYMRVIATNSMYPDSSLGTLVHLTIGIPSDSVVVTPDHLTYCEGDVAQIIANPWNGDSKYNWIQNNNPIAGVYNPLYLNLGGFTGTLNLQVRENNFGCYGPYSKAVSIKVNGKPSVTVTGPITLCVGDTGKYSIPFLNNTYYKWRVPKAAKLDTANNIAKVRFDTTGTFKIYVLAIDSCGADSAIRTVVVKPKLNVVITGASPVCAGTPVVLTVSGGNTYKWSTGSTTSTITVTPNKDSTYYVTASNGTCNTPDSIKIKVLPVPAVKVVPASKSICSGDSVLLTASGGQTYSWTPITGLNSDTGSTVLTKPSNSQTYIVSGTGANGCIDTATVKISVTTSPKVSVSPTTSTICTGDSVTLKATGAQNFTWTPALAVSKDTGSVIKVFPSATQTYQVVGKSGTCKDSSSAVITVFQTPVVSAFPNNQTICVGDSITLNATGAVNYSWSPFNSLSSDTGSSVTAHPTSTTTYYVLGTIGSSGCGDTAKVTVKTFVPAATISPTVKINQGESASLLATGGALYIWSPTTGLSCTTCANPVATPEQTTTYYVLVRDSVTGCLLKKSVEVIVEPLCGEIYVPTAFSPNEDGNNDIFYVRARCLSNLDFKIFDRWGEVVFHTTNAEAGWDGNFRGAHMNTAVFYYSLDATTTSGLNIKRKGNISLVR